MKFDHKHRPPSDSSTIHFEAMRERIMDWELWADGQKTELREALKRNPPMAARAVILELLGEKP